MQINNKLLQRNYKLPAILVGLAIISSIVMIFPGQLVLAKGISSNECMDKMPKVSQVSQLQITDQRDLQQPNISKDVPDRNETQLTETTAIGSIISIPKNENNDQGGSNTDCYQIVIQDHCREGYEETGPLEYDIPDTGSELIWCCPIENEAIGSSQL
ncbi:MAG: hypothetical protein R2685_15490 [Candidatus Nitrosocosmicus sp.]|nr:hypothetical protein [Candidatus Nitrosocosmicus sp.]